MVTSKSLLYAWGASSGVAMLDPLHLGWGNHMMRYTMINLKTCQSVVCIRVGTLVEGCRCSKIAEAEAALICQRKEVVSDAYACAAEARRASGPPKPLAHCDMKVSGHEGVWPRLPLATAVVCELQTVC